MKRINKTYIWLVVGILLFCIGSAIDYRYENAKETGYEVIATVTDVKYHVDHDVDGGPDRDEYIAYGTYTVDGKQYNNIRLGTYSSEINVGDRIPVIVAPHNPARIISDGGLLIVPGFLIVIISIVVLVKSKKKNNQRNQKPMNNQTPVIQYTYDSIMKCVYCGTNIETHDKYCPKCGKELRSQD